LARVRVCVAHKPLRTLAECARPPRTGEPSLGDGASGQAAGGGS